MEGDMHDGKLKLSVLIWKITMATTRNNKGRGIRRVTAQCPVDFSS